MIKNPPIQDITLLPTGKFTQTWIAWFQGVRKILSGGEPLPLASYTVLTLPPIPEKPSLIYVSDATGGPIPAYSDGVNWRRVNNSAIIS